MALARNEDVVLLEQHAAVQALRRGVEGQKSEIDRQRAEGSWDESAAGRNGEAVYTGTGFPRVFYLAYHLYRDYFPLLALTAYRKSMERGEAA